MRSERVKKGDLVIELRNRDGSYRLHSQKGVVAESVMDRINERIARLTPWVVCIGDDNWPLPEPLSNADAQPSAYADMLALMDESAKQEADMAESFEAIDAEYPNDPHAHEDAKSARKRERLYRCAATALREAQRMLADRASRSSSSTIPEPETRHD